MFAIPEQFSNATKANFESQFAIFSSLTAKAFEGMEKLVELNITAAKASLEESSIATRQLLAAKDPQEFFSLTAAQAQPTAEKALSYSQPSGRDRCRHPSRIHQGCRNANRRNQPQGHQPG